MRWLSDSNVDCKCCVNHILCGCFVLFGVLVEARKQVALRVLNLFEEGQGTILERKAPASDADMLCTALVTRSKLTAPKVDAAGQNGWCGVELVRERGVGNVLCQDARQTKFTRNCYGPSCSMAMRAEVAFKIGDAVWGLGCWVGGVGLWTLPAQLFDATALQLVHGIGTQPSGASETLPVNSSDCPG